jgi:hypothetical protein
MSKEGAGAATADGDFVADQVHFVTIAQGAGEAQIFRVIHRHAGRALNQRFDDQRSNFFAMLFEVLFQCACGTAGAVE